MAAVSSLAYLDENVTITVQGTTLTVVPEVFLISRSEFADRMMQATQDAEELSELAAKLAKAFRQDKQIAAWATKAHEELAELARERASGLTEKARKDASAVIGGPGIFFEVSGLTAGQVVEINFGTQGRWKGPFLFGSTEPGRPVRGRYELTEQARRVASGQVDLEHFPTTSVWKYELVLRENGRDLVAIDPMGVLI